MSLEAYDCFSLTFGDFVSKVSNDLANGKYDFKNKDIFKKLLEDFAELLYKFELFASGDISKEDFEAYWDLFREYYDKKEEGKMKQLQLCYEQEDLYKKLEDLLREYDTSKTQDITIDNAKEEDIWLDRCARELFNILPRADISKAVGRPAFMINDHNNACIIYPDEPLWRCEYILDTKQAIKLLHNAYNTAGSIGLFLNIKIEEVERIIKEIDGYEDNKG